MYGIPSLSSLIFNQRLACSWFSSRHYRVCTLYGTFETRPYMVNSTHKDSRSKKKVRRPGTVQADQDYGAANKFAKSSTHDAAFFDTIGPRYD